MLNEEKKITLTLNPYTFSVLENDARIFSSKQSLGNLINTIIVQYRESSSVSFSLRIQEERERFAADLIAGNKKGKKKLSPEDIDSITDIYIKGYTDRLTKKEKKPFSKGISKLITLNNESYSLLYPNPSNINNWPEAKYYPTQNAYIKALLEDYVSQPFYQREQICFRRTIDQLNNLLDIPEEKRGLIIITTESVYSGLRQLRVRSYKLMTDPESRFTYLVGYMAGMEDEAYRIASLRISRIKKAERSYKEYAPLTKSEKAEIEAAIKSRGVAYLIGETETITVKLTKDGMKKYNSILHLRPHYIKKEDQDEYTILSFSCSQMQIKNYFLQFGADSVIVSPKQLSNDLKHLYDNAANAYNDN